MQDERKDMPAPYENLDGASFEARSYESGYSTNENYRKPEIFYGVRDDIADHGEKGSRQEQVQEFSPQQWEYSGQEQVQEFASQQEEYGEAGYEDNSMSTYAGEKVTNLPLRSRSFISHKGIGAIMAITALLFFLVAGSVARLATESHYANPGPSYAYGYHYGDMRDQPTLFLTPNYVSIGQQTIADGLHTTPEAISDQLREGQSLTDIAIQQGISGDQLHTIELQAIQNISNQALSDGKLNQWAANRLVDRYEDNPQLLDQVAPSLFFMNHYYHHHDED